MLAVEILNASGAVAALIREKKTFQLPSVIQTGKREGMITMYEDGLRKALSGVTTFEEVLRATRES